LECQADYIQWPQIVVGQRLDKQFRRNGLSVVHGGFRWILTDTSIDYDFLLTVPFCITITYYHIEQEVIRNKAYRSENQPSFPRSQLAVLVGAAGIRTAARTPTTSVIRPCT